MLGAEDDGTTTIVSVAVKRVIKQSTVKIRKGKMFMYPESWTVMGCTCPALIPRKYGLLEIKQQLLHSKIDLLIFQMLALLVVSGLMSYLVPFRNKAKRGSRYVSILPVRNKLPNHFLKECRMYLKQSVLENDMLQEVIGNL